MPPDAEGIQSESRLHSTLDDLLEGTQIVDRDWRYLYLNPAAARHGGREVSDLLGRTMPEAYPGIEQTPMFDLLRRSMQSRERAEMENEFIGPDGAARWFQLLIQPVTEGLFILSVDITERKIAEAALRESRARFETVFENLQEGLILSDLAGNLLHWNRAALTLYGFANPSEASEAVDGVAPLFELYTLDGMLLGEDERPLARILRGEDFQHWELRLRRIGRTWERTLAYSGATVRYGENGSEGLAFLSINDVTERNVLQRQFVRAQRLESIGELAGGMVHDLNNILMPILMGVTMLRRLEPRPQSRKTVDNIERAARRGADLVRQILSFARGVSGWSATIDPRQVIADTEAIVRSTFPKNVVLVKEIEEDLHAVSGDETQLLQVVLNLVINARDAMTTGGKIVVSANNAEVDADAARSKGCSAGRYVRFEVIDEGTGMTSEVLAQIFDPFFTTKEGTGTGLGLFTVRDIVRSHGGFIDVSSVPGEGTTFRVFLPAAVAGSVAAAAETDDVALLPRGAGELILVVDDEASILTVAQQTLELFGYEVLAANDGAEALAAFAAHPSMVSVVLTDMVMGNVDGAAMIAELRRHSPSLPIIATSGNSSDDWIARARQAGATHILAKPYTAPRLLRMVADILSRAAGE